MAYFEYDCPICDNQLKGSFGDDIICNECNKSFETDWDGDGYAYHAWITKQIIEDDTTDTKL